MRAYRGVVRVVVDGGLYPLVAALQFLTRLPLPVRLPDSKTITRRSAMFYPAAGLLIGAFAALAAYALTAALPFYVAAALVLGLWVYLTGGLHLDGWMDTADGLLSYRSRERMLEIMKDSRVGAMGVIACVLLLLTKMMLLAALLDGSWAVGIAAFEPGGHAGLADQRIAGVLAEQPAALLQRCLLLSLVPVWSRAFLPAAIVCWPYARQEGAGLGGMFRAVRVRHAAAAFALAVALTMAMLSIGGGWDWREALIACAALATASAFVGGVGAFFVSRKLGGLTGDVYGALNELIELALLLGLVVVVCAN